MIRAFEKARTITHGPRPACLIANPTPAIRRSYVTIDKLPASGHHRR